ncbi:MULTISPECIES: hypothetical protein [Mycolicibacterium]|uniref:hypothetical protein n=1 Tax=Mycolicibacterium TaxID=1866885 RepID=UPI0007E96273|nr:hypothetical protein [Mycolicibacterium fortuitum]OBA93292.1 hypothetical protein A5665_09880 [Mycolicibacterium fortuitum]OBB38368.1 hypothetical protein A5763_28890 [Mycolicibacterium fortuitum]OBB50967.1 hypothetical protein A5754_25100 [Mycolicibacterium fortuitum]OBB61765.1 hypothetical protein A5755_23825 [Mycolicibacterium fortuitum]
MRGGLPRPVTQIPVADENDIVRLGDLAARGWTIVRVSAGQLQFRQHEIVARAYNAIKHSRRNYGL